MPPSHNIHQQLETMYLALFRFAYLQLRNKAQAEDAVQEACLAVLEKPERFAGRSSFHTYVNGILKFKIIDILRLSEKERQLPIDDDSSDSDIIDSLCNANCHPLQLAHALSGPDTELEQKDFFNVIEICLEKLPAKTARVFMMHEWLDWETDEICKELNLTKSNLWIRLFRARLKLREYLGLRWFDQKA
ncbi:MAG: sigma-70 family RNA polymerase sigma factor [Pseudomonadota bacterium]